MSLIKDLIFTHCVIMPRLSPKERVSRRYKEHIDSLTEGENSHEHPPSFFPVRQERVAAGGVLCYIYLAIDKGEHGSYLPVQMEPDTVLYFYSQWE